MDSPFCFDILWLLRHLKKQFSAAQLKICTLNLELANAFTKAWLSITFVEIGCSLVIIQSDSFIYRFANFYQRTKILLFLILLELTCWKLHKPILQVVLEAEKLKKKKTKCISNWLTPQNLPFQIWCSHYFFVNKFCNYNPRIEISLFLDSEKAGLLKKVWSHFSRCFECQEMSKRKVGTFFWNTL